MGGPGGPVPPHFLADQLTLSQPGGAHYPHPALRAPPDFPTLRRPCTCTATGSEKPIQPACRKKLVHFAKLISIPKCGYFQLRCFFRSVQYWLRIQVKTYITNRNFMSLTRSIPIFFKAFCAHYEV